MFRKAIVLVLGLVFATTLVSAGGAVSSTETPVLKGIFVSGGGLPPTVKRGALVRYNISVGTNRRSDVPSVKVRAYLPGVKIMSKQLLVDPSFHVRYTLKQVPGGAYWTFSRLPSGFGFTAQFNTKVSVPIGRKPCDKVVLTLGNGKTATYQLGCYTVR